MWLRPRLLQLWFYLHPVFTLKTVAMPESTRRVPKTRFMSTLLTHMSPSTSLRA